MTLRARLTAAFLAVVLGPVLLGSVFVGVTVAAVGKSRSIERLDVATVGVRTAVGVACQRLRTAAQMSALLAGAQIADPGNAPAAAGRSAAAPASDEGTGPAGQVVARQMATAIVLTGAGGTTTTAAGTPPPYPWLDCAASLAAGGSPRGRQGGLAARVEVRNGGGDLIGYATAVDPINAAFVARLAGAGGVEVSVYGGGTPLSTEPSGEVSEVTALGGRLGRHQTGETGDGRYVRRLDPEAEQPMTLMLSAPASDSQGLYTALASLVLGAGLLSVVAASLLGRSTARPLTDLAAAVDRVAAGDLTARIPVSNLDEVGRLGATFNRMTKETQGYVQALTASRDQLRRQLGVLGDTLSSTHDLNRILRVILQTASAATGAQAGVVLLADPSTGVLVGQCAEGIVGRGDVTELRLRLGEGLLGAVAASGEPSRTGRCSSPRNRTV